MSNSEYDRLVNDKWSAAALPIPDDKNAMRGARALYRKAMGKPWRGKVEIVRRKNQYTWVRRGVLVVNPNRPARNGSGWPDITHLISHLCHARLRPNERPHSRHQQELEKTLTNYALSDAFKKYTT